MNKRRLSDAMIATAGFILSPLTWWNDLLVNVPLAYLFSWPFSAIHEQLFVPSFILGYWLTNLLGLLMLHFGGAGLLKKQRDKFSIKNSFVVSLIYSALIFIIVMLGWIESPTEYLMENS
ncbi:hypothetical protein ACFL3P_03960 [Pseudomonadota bacterium]